MLRSNWLLVLVVVPLLGCDAGKPPLAPVKGKVTYRGKPVTNASVQFVADASKGASAPSAVGQTDDAGAFTLKCPPHGPGAVPGSYRVIVMAYGSPLPAKFVNPKTTPLEIKVPHDGVQDLVVAITD